MYLRHIPGWLQRLYPGYTWRLPAEGSRPTLYLTFDDGPTPDITNWVLGQLAAYEAQATFFWVGDQVRKYPELAHQVLDAGHAVGNHTQRHLNGGETSTKRYLRDVLQAQRTILEYTGHTSRLFRPPYGRLQKDQRNALRQQYEIVMMDVISGDFDLNRTGADCARTVIRKARPGSIVLLHDSLKAWPRIKEALPRILEHFAARDFVFAAHPDAVAAPEVLPSPFFLA